MNRPGSLNSAATPKEIILCAIIVVFGIFMMVNKLYKPQWTLIDQIETKLTALDAEKTSIQKFEAAILKKQNTLSIATPKTSSSNVRLQIVTGDRTSAVSDITHLIGQLTSDRFLRDVRLRTVNYEPTTADQGYNHTDIEVEVSGSYYSIVEYLSRLERLETLLHLTSLSLKPAEKNPSLLIAQWKAEFYEMGGI